MVTTSQLRLAAALAHSSADADVELDTDGRRWIVSNGHPHASLNPCVFRRLVLAAMEGTPIALFPTLAAIHVTGALRDVGAGIYEREGERGTERQLASFLSPEHLRELLVRVGDGAGDHLRAHVRRDDELGVSVVVLTTAHPARTLQLDVVAHALASACFVDELIGVDHQAAS